MMEARILSIVMDTNASSQDRIRALRQLGVVRQNRIGEQVAQPAKDLAVCLRDLPGRRELQRVIQRQRDPVDVRCTAVAVAAETDNKSVLDWCNDMIKQYL